MVRVGGVQETFQAKRVSSIATFLNNCFGGTEACFQEGEIENGIKVESFDETMSGHLKVDAT